MPGTRPRGTPWHAWHVDGMDLGGDMLILRNEETADIIKAQSNQYIVF